MKKRFAVWAAGALYGAIVLGCIYLVKNIFGTTPEWIDIWLGATIASIAGFDYGRS